MTRRRREVVTLPDGTPVVQTKPPRADLLRYPGHRGEVTVLVRRTHDPQLARQLAAERWPAAGDPRPLGPSRTGWWTTTPARGRTRVPDGAAVDEQGRIVVWADPSGSVAAAGPGIEYRAARPGEGTQENTR